MTQQFAQRLGFTFGNRPDEAGQHGLAVRGGPKDLVHEFGGVVSAARNVVSGADNVARFLLGIAAKRPDMSMEEQQFGDGLGFVFREGDDVVSVMNLHVERGAITQLWIVLNPAKLTHWLHP